MKYPHNISRIEAFNDAVFALAATLLVVSVGFEESSSVIKIDWIAFISFFVLVALCWLHYNFFRRTDYMDARIVALNAILLFLVLYYVFPLKSLINSWTGNQLLNLYVPVAALSIIIAKLQLGLQIALHGIIYALLGPLCYFHGIRFAKNYQTNEI